MSPASVTVKIPDLNRLKTWVQRAEGAGLGVLSTIARACGGRGFVYFFGETIHRAASATWSASVVGEGGVGESLAGFEVWRGLAD